MVEKLKQTKPPSGFTRWLYRLPILLYRAGLGWMLGSRFLLLEHIGRVTGKRRQTVLEVVDSEPASGIFYVVAAWGERADWYQNIKSISEVSYQVGRRHFEGKARPLPQEEAEQVFLAYGHSHPRALQSLMRVLGYRIESNDQSYRALAEHLPVVKLSPDEGKGD